MVLLHISDSKIDQIVDAEQSPDGQPAFKPRGLWYSPNKTWINWAKENLDRTYNKSNAYYYALSFKYTTFDIANPNRVLQIHNDDIFDKFTFEYGKMVDFNSGYMLLIDWYAVAMDFGGVEIIPLLEDRYNKLGNINKNRDLDTVTKYKLHGFDMDNIRISYYDTWDIASGCVWNSRAIKKWKQILKKKKTRITMN